MFKTVLLIMAFGAFGAVARFGLGTISVRLFGGHFPYGTLIANVLGCFLFGVIVQWAAFGALPDCWKLGLLTGFLGALTTFSAFGWETLNLAQSGGLYRALTNIGLNVVLGLSAVALGYYLGGTVGTFAARGGEGSMAPVAAELEEDSEPLQG